MLKEQAAPAVHSKQVLQDRCCQAGAARQMLQDSFEWHSDVQAPIASG